MPTIATIETAVIDSATLPAAMQRIEEEQHRAALTNPGLFAAGTLLDTRAWTVSRVRLWADAQSVRGVSPHAERYEVLRTVGPALVVLQHLAFET